MTTDNTNTTRNDSLAARTDTWLQSFLVWSPGQRDIIKTVALVLMVLDHINRHCCKVSDEAAFCLIQRPYISKTLLTRRISPRGSP